MKFALLAVSAVAVVCAIGRFKAWLSRTVVCMHMAAKDYTLPTDEELRAYVEEILRRTFRPKSRV